MIYRDQPGVKSESDFSSERDILYKVLFDMKNDINDLKKLTMELMKEGGQADEEFRQENAQLLAKVYEDYDAGTSLEVPENPSATPAPTKIINTEIYADEDVIEESLTLQDKEIEMIRKALDRNAGKRKDAAKELGISERTLYRKIKQYDL
jgi:transcriptional regulator of acetoin/glycerol metabolism